MCNFFVLMITVIIERKRKTYRRAGHPRVLKPKPKHPLRIHIWGTIPLVMFKENLTAFCLGKIFEAGLIPFVRSKFSDSHKFQMDNDPKHTSHCIKDFLKDHYIEWWKMPAESPDLNPIEKVWGSLKISYVRKLENRNLSGLKTGIRLFWKTLMSKVCRKYINHV